MGDFYSYSILTTISGQIKALSPMRIGAGKALSVITSDLPVIKNSKNEPIIPGSSLKGFFRGHLQKILMMRMKDEEAKKLITEIFGGSNEDDNASSVLFHELRMKEGRIAERKHIAIDPETGGARRGSLFEVECLLEGAVFEGKILSARNLNPKALALIKPVMDLANLGLARIGGFKSRGYGEIAIEIDEIVMTFPGKDLKDLEVGFEVRNLIPEKFGSIKVKKTNGGFSLDNLTFEAELKENDVFFGVELRLKKEKATEFLRSLLKTVKI